MRKRRKKCVFCRRLLPHERQKDRRHNGEQKAEIARAVEVAAFRAGGRRHVAVLQRAARAERGERADEDVRRVLADGGGGQGAHVRTAVQFHDVGRLPARSAGC